MASVSLPIKPRAHGPHESQLCGLLSEYQVPGPEEGTQRAESPKNTGHRSPSLGGGLPGKGGISALPDAKQVPDEWAETQSPALGLQAPCSLVTQKPSPELGSGQAAWEAKTAPQDTRPACQLSGEEALSRQGRPQAGGRGSGGGWQRGLPGGSEACEGPGGRCGQNQEPASPAQRPMGGGGANPWFPCNPRQMT